MLKKHKLDCALLFKNSFASVMTAFFAGIPGRIGYAREGRGFLLTDKLFPARLPDGKFKPVSMVDYYLEIAKHLGADTSDRTLELSVDPKDRESLRAKLPQVVSSDKPIVIFVPGGAFGQSKCWPAGRFAQTAERLISDYNAEVIVSVASNQEERQIAEEICSLSRYKLVSLAETPISLGELKALFSIADLVISNDTGPRHIAIALRRKVIGLFGPNDPAWTDSGYENEIQIVGNVPCAPCARPKCKEVKHLCMESITVEMVCEAAAKLLGKNQK
jgi:heptosyltransferase-2